MLRDDSELRRFWKEQAENHDSGVRTGSDLTRYRIGLTYTRPYAEVANSTPSEDERNHRSTAARSSRSTRGLYGSCEGKNLARVGTTMFTAEPQSDRQWKQEGDCQHRQQRHG